MKGIAISSIITMNMTSEQKHFFECIRKEAFFEKKHKLSNLKLVNTFSFSILSCLNIGSV